MRVAVVVVTYNRLSLLKECLAALKNQTLKINKIFIINNGSTDGTTEWLAQQDGFVIVNQENLGSSGGFSKGISMASEENFDWIWVMDDDAEPALNCLENCLKAANGNDVDIIAPLLLKASTNKVDVMHRGTIVESLMKFESVPHLLREDKVNTDYVENVEFVSFVGPIYSKKAVQIVGVPKAELFLHHDDFEYSLRMKDAGLKSLLVYSAMIFHKEAAHVHEKSKWFKFNKPTSKQKLFIKYFSPRNKAFIVRKRKGILAAIIISFPVLVREFTRHLFINPILLPGRLSFFFNAVTDGIRGNLDNGKSKRLIDKLKK